MTKRIHTPEQRIAELTEANRRLRTRLAQADKELTRAEAKAAAAERTAATLAAQLRATTTVWRVRWRRPGWKPHQRKVRYFPREADAQRWADRLASAPATDHGRIDVELASCRATIWQNAR